MAEIYDYEPLFDGWKVGERLGAGGFGEVYAIYKTVSGITQPAAVKRISLSGDKLAKSPKLLSLVQNEIQTMISLKDAPHIVKIEGFDIKNWKREEGTDFLIRMEKLDSLESKIANARLPVDEIVKLGIHICLMLEICEKHDIIHRDIKPANIFITKYGDYKLGDFGIARILTDGLASSQIGTSGFMAPEIFKMQKKYDKSVDIYSLGITLYYLLNGNRLPFEGEESEESPIIRRIDGEALPVLRGVPKELMDAVLKACANKPENRFNNATEMRKALQYNLGVRLEESKKKRQALPESVNELIGRIHEALATLIGKRFFWLVFIGIIVGLLFFIYIYNVVSNTSNVVSNTSSQQSPTSNQQSSTSNQQIAQIYYDAGVTSVNNKDYDDAITQFTEAIRLEPDYDYAYAQRGEAYRLKGQYDAAVRECDNAITINPINALAYATRGQAYRQLGQRDLAIKDLAKALSLNKNLYWVKQELSEIQKTLAATSSASNQQSAQAYYDKGLFYSNNNDYDDAITQYNEAIRLKPNYAYAYAHRGEAYLMKGQYDTAIKDFDNAIKIEPDYDYAYAQRGEAYRLKGQYDTAIRDLDNAIIINPNYAWAYATRGQAYRQLGNRVWAIKDLEKALSINPNLDWAKQELSEIWGY